MLGLPFLFLLSCLSLQAQPQRFQAEQLQFVLIENEGEEVSCQHELLPQVPWWRVSCGARQYTVDIWMQLLRHQSQNLTRLSLMYHASEGVASSGEKLVQFKSHWTHFDLEGGILPKRISSELDVRNGQAWLRATAQL